MGGKRLVISSVAAVIGVIAVVSVALYATDAAAEDAFVSVGDNFYEPGAITVEVGSTVTWTNNGLLLHTVTSDEGLFDSGFTLEPGTSYSVYFEFPAYYSYYCQVHGTIQSGSVRVQGPPTPTPTRSPTPTPTPTAPPTATPAPVVTTAAGTPTSIPTPAITRSTSPSATATPVEEEVESDESGDRLAVLGLAALGLLAVVGVYALVRGRRTG